MRRSQLVRRMKILSPAILAFGWRGWGNGGRWAASRRPPCPLKSNTHVSVCVCVCALQADSRSSGLPFPRLVREGASPRGSDSPALPGRGLRRWGERRSESEGLEGSGEGGGQNKTQIRKKSTDGCQRLGTIRWELRGRETRVASFAQDGGKIQKKSSPANPCSCHFFLMEFR